MEGADITAKLDLLDQKIELLEDKISKKVIMGILSKLPVKQFYTVQEFSNLTGLEEKTITNYCKNKTIQAKQFVVRGNWLIKATELETYLKEAEDHSQAIQKKKGKRNLTMLEHRKKANK